MYWLKCVWEILISSKLNCWTSQGLFCILRFPKMWTAYAEFPSFFDLRSPLSINPCWFLFRPLERASSIIPQSVAKKNCPTLLANVHPHDRVHCFQREPEMFHKQNKGILIGTGNDLSHETAVVTSMSTSWGVAGFHLASTSAACSTWPGLGLIMGWLILVLDPLKRGADCQEKGQVSPEIYDRASPWDQI